ncbi:FkbM family methyltransferase [Nocardiopsis sp. HNM0947]|uniref:FkbM family methyltransferase n=1 Tax=Nocardiopsis coralli TaxID=2772213 RepID=A0ABR9PAF7_9ACTN|nr:FkbM family methyltransferase [Nocardiopsis coralli]
MPTLLRRGLNLLRTLNVRVQDLEPGTALVSRNHGYEVVPLGRGSWVVRRGKPDVQRTHKAVMNHLAAEHVASLLYHYRADCVLDVGANTGQYAKQLRRYGYRGRIVSFEPVPEITEKLRRASANDPDWHVYPYALGREDRTDTINVVYGSMSSMLGPSEFGTTRYKRFKRSRGQEIEVRRLDGLLDKVLDGLDDPRPYLKLDTQGFDLEAYAGGGDRVREFVGLQSEVALMQIYEGMPRMAEAVATFEADGFEITGMYPVTREETTGRVLEFDCVMARADAM